jgi:hypothetical protein
MSNKYGPQTAQIETLLETVKSLNEDQINALGVAWDYSPWNIAWNAARAVISSASRDIAFNDARCAAFEFEPGITRASARGTYRATVLALLARDLIGDKFTQNYYDILTGSWRKIIGPVHPDDADIRISK